MSMAFNLYVVLAFAGLLMLTIGYAGRRLKTGLGLMVVGIVTLLGMIMHYFWTVLS